MEKSENSRRTRRLVQLAMLCALSVVLMLFVRFPLLATAPFLEFSMLDIPLLIAAFIYGPWYAASAALVVCVLQGLTVSAGAGIIGIAMNFITTSTFCIVAGLVYRRHKTLGGGVAALAAGGLALAAVAIPCNLLLTPIYMHVPVETVREMIIPVLLPFNLLRAVINAIITFLIYKPVGRLFGGAGNSEA